MIDRQFTAATDGGLHTAHCARRARRQGPPALTPVTSTTLLGADPPRSNEFDQVAMIVKGRAIYHIGDEPNEVGPGSLMLIPAGVEHYIEPIGDETVENIDLFAPAREDYLHLLEWMPPR
jgi:mannose-6-phosphate isomerase-like protein (cupin superfamily)